MIATDENRVLSDTCLPPYLLRANPSVILDAQYDDFDQQAERLVGFDQTYLQLTPGAFRGRFLSCFLGSGLSLHLEHCTQALEQLIGCDPDAYTFAVLVTEGAVFRLNGTDFSSDCVMIATPGTGLHLYSPANGTILVITIARDQMERTTWLSGTARDWLAALRNEARLLRAPQLVRRMREDTVQALEAAHFCRQDAAHAAGVIGEALFSGLMSKLSLELCAKPEARHMPDPVSFDRMIACRDAIHRKWATIHSMEDLLSETGLAGRRAIETTFARQFDLGPLTYHRILRLHLARKALRDTSQFNTSIGDIAAQYEFWNWSQFSSQYHALFGQRPSETRTMARLHRTS